MHTRADYVLSRKGTGEKNERQNGKQRNSTHCKNENSSRSPVVHHAFNALPKEKMPRNSWDKKMAALKTRRPQNLLQNFEKHRMIHGQWKFQMSKVSRTEDIIL